MNKIPVIDYCYYSNPASEKHTRENKSPYTCTFVHLVTFIDNHVQSCYSDKPFTCTHCVICIPCFVHLISMYSTCMCTKDHLGFFLILVTHKSTKLENSITWILTEWPNQSNMALHKKKCHTWEDQKENIFTLKLIIHNPHSLGDGWSEIISLAILK